MLATGGMLLLVFGLVKAPDQGWGATNTIAELAGAAALVLAFLGNEGRGGATRSCRSACSGSAGSPPLT